MEKKDIKIGFAIRKVTTEQFAIIESSFDANKQFDLNIGLKFGVNKENKVISVFFLTNLIQNKKPFLVLEVGCHFNINDEAWQSFLNKDETELLLPQGFISHLVVLSIGTARGVLHCKTENTPFNEFILPTINVNTLIQKDIPIKLNEPTP